MIRRIALIVRAAVEAAPWIVAAVLAVAVVWLRIEAQAAAREARALALAVDSLEAAADTLKVVLADEAGRAWLWQQRAVQAEIERDKLARALDQQRKATARIELRIDTLRVLANAPVDTGAAPRDTLRLTFAERLRYGAEEIGALFAHVMVPPQPDSATLVADVALDSIVVVPEVRCGAPGPAGIRPALVTVRTPTWILARADSARVDPTICNAESRALSGRSLLRDGLLLIGGFVIGRASR